MGSGGRGGWWRHGEGLAAGFEFDGWCGRAGAGAGAFRGAILRFELLFNGVGKGVGTIDSTAIGAFAVTTHSDGGGNVAGLSWTGSR